MRRGSIIAAACILAALGAGRAGAEPGAFVGVAEDGLKYRTAESAAVARDLGLKSFRITLGWEPGQTELAVRDSIELDRAVIGAGAMRVVLAVYADRAVEAPVDDAGREAYCTYVRNVLGRYPQINDIVIWNEPNLTYFWRPQYNPDGSSASPVAYEALLARCWDVLHEARPGVNVIGPATSPWGDDHPFATSHISHSPSTFIRTMGIAYRASKRVRPLFDTVGHHTHPLFPTDRPWRVHADSRFVMLGDWEKLMSALHAAFWETPQRIPGQGVPIWYLEVGFETAIDEDKRHLYTGAENSGSALPDYAGGEPDTPAPAQESRAPDQHTQILDAVRLAACQPYVGAYFGFLLRDQEDLSTWQSGVQWADGTKKDSYGAFAAVTAEVNEGRVDCSKLKGGVPPGYNVSRPPTPERAKSAGTGAAATRTAGAGGGTSSAADKRGTRIAYTGSTAGVFGFVKLSARLGASGSDDRLAGRRLTFQARGKRLAATTDTSGTASARMTLPLQPGRTPVEIAFAGDEAHHPAAGEAAVTVTNSWAAVKASGRTRGLRDGSFELAVDPRRRTGILRFRGGGIRLRTRALTAFGVAPDGRSAWLAGVGARGERIVAYLEDNSTTFRYDVFRLWVDRRPVTASGRILRGDGVRITRSR